MNDITYAVSVDVNNPIISYNVYVASVLDSNVRYLEITLYQNGNIIALSNTATATASLVTDNVLVDDSVNCTISDNIITVPLEDLQRHGNLDVQVTVTEGTKVLAIPFPIQVRVTPNIAENAQIDENSLGSYAEVVHEIAEARGTHTTLHDAITAKLDDTDGSVKENNIAEESITVEKVADDLAAVINAKEVKTNKKTTLTGNESSNDYYPTIKAVVDYLAAFEINAGSVGFDETETYAAGSIGAEVSAQKNAIKNLEAIPTEVKRAMDTLFSKAAYADDDAASSYATFHAWAIPNLVTLFVQPNIAYAYDSGKLAASENRSATSLISIDDTSITHTVSATVNGVEVDILLRVFDQNGLAFNSSELAKSQTIPAKDYKCFGVVLAHVVTANDVVTVTVDGVQEQASYGTLEEYSNTVPVDIQVGGIDGTTGEIIENSARLITGFIDIVPGLFSGSAPEAQLLLTAQSGVYVKAFEYSDSSFLQNSSIGALVSNQARGNPASACTKFRVLFKKSDNSNFTSEDIESLTLNNHDIVTYEFTEVN